MDKSRLSVLSTRSTLKIVVSIILVTLLVTFVIYSLDVNIGLAKANFSITSSCSCPDEHKTSPDPAIPKCEDGDNSWRNAFMKNQLSVAESNWNRGRNRSAPVISEILERNSTPGMLTIWDLLYPSFTCPFTVERLGRVGDGGKWVCGFEEHVIKKSPCLVYSFGISYESTFEEEILERCPNCTVRMFDHTIGGVGFVNRYPGRAIWYPYGISGRDSGTSGDLRTLKALLESNQDEYIDILKMDVETAEFSALENILEDFAGRPLPFAQLLIEVHLAPVPMVERMKSLIAFTKSLEDAGLRAFQAELNFLNLKTLTLSEFAFLNIRAKPFKL